MKYIAKIALLLVAALFIAIPDCEAKPKGTMVI